MELVLGEERRAVVAYCHRMVADGLVVGTSGNISARRGELIAVTPSGLAYEELTPDLVGVHRLDGTPVDAPLAPTTELPTHLAAYQATGGNAVVHTHSAAATAVATLVDELPSVHYLVALFGGPIRVARYATYGTDELAESVTAALAGRTGCLLGNHGTIAVGDTLAKAYAKAQYLEWLCDVWLRAKAAGEPRVLDAAEIDRVGRKLASYGASAPEVRGADATPDSR
ncbi:class II aldolase/adducin family protein [Hamadaea sp. NPDC050747]|uniref:class II aldolase/adducin family protein n=1 Tax=Hamadaea sp. NPDC050747 TaxID=3155789 RepID=UPI0033FFE1B2